LNPSRSVIESKTIKALKLQANKINAITEWWMSFWLLQMEILDKTDRYKCVFMQSIF